MNQLVDNLVIDEDTGVPVGVGFDDFIRLVKTRRSVQNESKYVENLERIIKHLVHHPTYMIESI